MSVPYSEWLKIDLHVHTDWSCKTKSNDYSGNFSVDTLKEALVENEVAIFSLTDHNIINIDAYKQYYATCDVCVDPLLLVGVELDIIVGVNDEKTYHSLIVFNHSSEEQARLIHEKLEQKYKEKNADLLERTLTIDELIDLFPEDDYFFIPHAGNTKSIIDPYRGEINVAQEMIILMQSALEKVKEQKRQIYNEGFNNVLNEAFQNKNDHAYIEFSDNHCIESYPRSSNGADGQDHAFYYVKGGKNFETLRQAFIDPKSRIKSSDSYASLRKSPRYLESINFQGIDTIEDGVISFSPHLNVIIGGRSSGKSLLMNLLGHKIDSTKDKPKDDYGVDLEKVKIKAIQDSGPSKETSIPSNRITYIQQGEIVGYFEAGDLKELAHYTGKREEYLEAKQAFIGRRGELDALLKKLISSYDDCHCLSSEKFVLHQSTLDHILGTSFTFQWDQDVVFGDHDISGQIESESEVIEGLTDEIKEFMECSLVELDEEDIALIEAFTELVDRKANLLNKKKSANAIKLSFLHSISDLICQKNEELDEDARQKDASIRTLREVKIKARDTFKKLSELRTRSSDLASFDCKIRKEIDLQDGIRLVLELRESVIDRIDGLIIDGIKNGASEKSLYWNLLALLRGRASLKNYSEASTSSLQKKIAKQIEDIHLLFDAPADYLEYEDGESSLNKSPGYNSEKYLEIILKSGETEIIIIDQPEDNLGNAFIADSLVEIIRDIKFSKQVFLVTHNPSIVVHGDAENVVIATNNDKVIRYSQVVIEDNESKRAICKILDGGEYIFHTRSRKYNIQKLLKGGRHG